MSKRATGGFSRKTQLHGVSYHRKAAPDTHWIGGTVGPKSGLNVLAKRRIIAPDYNRSPVIQPVASHFTD
jgi:hypothetical protein